MEGSRQVRTRERARPSGQERSILNAVPGSAAEAEAGAAIRDPGGSRCGWRGDGDGVGRCAAAAVGGRLGVRLDDVQYSTTIYRAVALSELRKTPMSCRICCLNEIANCVKEHSVQDLADLCEILNC